MITGGTGSFGNAVLNRFLDTDIGEIRVFSRDEKKQDDMRHEFQAKMPWVADKIKFYIGDVRDIQFAVNEMNIDDDCPIIAGDNLLDFSLTDFVKYAVSKGTSAVMRYYEPTTAKLQKSGVLTIDDTDRVLEMHEKPAEPNSNWCCPPFYFYAKDDMRKIGKAISEGCGTDAPGSLVGWMCKQNAVYAMEMPGKRYDIGEVKSHEAICKSYKGIKQ